MDEERGTYPWHGPYVFPDQADVVPDQADVVPDQADVFPDQADVFPDQADVVPDHADVVPDQADVVQNQADVVQNQADVVPNQADVVPDQADVVPDQADVVPDCAEPTPSYAPNPVCLQWVQLGHISFLSQDRNVVTPSRPYSGKLVAVEGLDGSGKSTQIYLVKRWLELEGYRVFFTQWNSSALVKRSTTRGKTQQILTPTTFSLIHATDFADRYERQILPLLRAGYIVLADRYIFTAFTRDVVRGVDQDWVTQLYSFAVRPDITFYFRVPLETSLNRILEGRPTLKYHEAGMDMGWSSDPYESFRIFQGKIMSVYEELKDRFDFTVIDATREIHDQQSEVRKIIAERINLREFRL